MNEWWWWWYDDDNDDDGDDHDDDDNRDEDDDGCVLTIIAWTKKPWILETHKAVTLGLIRPLVPISKKRIKFNF